MIINPIDYWSPITNPEYGDEMLNEAKNLLYTSNGRMDVENFVRSEYGGEYAKRVQARIRFENCDPMCEEILAWHRERGLKKDLYEEDGFYSRWSIFTPLSMYEEANKGKKYPLVFWCHGGGGTIDECEFQPGYNEIAGKEGFMVAYLQNTNTDNVVRIIDKIAELYPLDRERVYISGFSQGGGKSSDCAFRAPMHFTAFAPCGNDIYRELDRFSVKYTQEETRQLTEAFLPFMQVVGCCEAANILPLNKWERRKDWPDGVRIPRRRKRDERYYTEVDPCRPSDPKNPGGRTYAPEGVDVYRWEVEQLNRRLDTLNIEHRDIERCVAYYHTPEDELHHVLGFYGDTEEIRYYYGYKHYVVNLWNRDGVNAFRYVAVENSGHFDHVMIGRLTWDFFKMFRRDSESGKIVVDEYRY